MILDLSEDFEREIESSPRGDFSARRAYADWLRDRGNDGDEQTAMYQEWAAENEIAPLPQVLMSHWCLSPGQFNDTAKPVYQYLRNSSEFAFRIAGSLFYESHKTAEKCLRWAFENVGKNE